VHGPFFLAMRKWSRRNSRRSGSEAVGPWDTSSETVGQVVHGAERLKNDETKKHMGKEKGRKAIRQEGK
jgi:hypothetical protein